MKFARNETPVVRGTLNLRAWDACRPPMTKRNKLRAWHVKKKRLITAGADPASAQIRRISDKK